MNVMIVMSIVALIFGGVLFAVISAVKRARSRITARELLKQQEPNRPWMWQEDWAAGRIADSGGATAVGLWIFAGLWNLVSGPLSYFLLSQKSVSEKPALLLILIFPLVGLLLLFAAIRVTLQKRKYGTSWFVLTTRPGVVGGKLRGTIETTIQQHPAEDVTLHLMCNLLETRRVGNKTSTEEHTLWEQKAMIAPPMLQTGMEGLRIPVSFDIPADVRPTDDSTPDKQIVWRLEATASFPGIDFSNEFDVPVFKTGEAPVPDESPELARKRQRQKVQAYATPASASTIIRQGQGGGTEFFFPPQGIGCVVGLLVFCLVWSGIILGLIKLDASFGFPFFIGLFGLAILLAMVIYVFQNSRVTFDSTNVTIVNKVLAWKSTHSFPRAEVVDVITKASGQARGKPNYEIQVKTRSGKPVNISAVFSDKHEAEWLAEKMRIQIQGR